MMNARTSAATRRRTELDHRAEAAIRYASELGWPILPTHGVDELAICTCGNPRCDRAGKHPARVNYKAMATTDPTLLRSYWRAVPFNLTLHIPTTLIVLDVDDLGALSTLRGFGPWPVTPTHATTRGVRMVFRWPLAGIAPSIGGIDRVKVDILGGGDLCILPPSVSATGFRYRWHAGEAPFDLPVAPLPIAYAEHVARIATARKARPHYEASVTSVEGATALARRRAAYARLASNGVGRGAAGLSRTLREAQASPSVVAMALDVFHAEAGR